MAKRTEQTSETRETETAAAIGDIVIYHHPATVQNPATESPAIIQALRDAGAVRLFVFAQGGAELVDNVAPGNAIGEWRWPGDARVAPPPVLTALTPDAVVLGSPSLTLHVQGSGFAATSVITFAGHDEPTTLVSPTEVTTGIDMSLWLGPDAVPVTVRNEDGTVSNALDFTFTAAPAREGEAPSRRTRG